MFDSIEIYIYIYISKENYFYLMENLLKIWLIFKMFSSNLFLEKNSIPSKNICHIIYKVDTCRDWVWAQFLRDEWIQAQQAQYNKFVKGR